MGIGFILKATYQEAEPWAKSDVYHCNAYCIPIYRLLYCSFANAEHQWHWQSDRWFKPSRTAFEVERNECM